MSKGCFLLWIIKWHAGSDLGKACSKFAAQFFLKGPQAPSSCGVFTKTGATALWRQVQGVAANAASSECSMGVQGVAICRPCCSVTSSQGLQGTAKWKAGQTCTSSAGPPGSMPTAAGDRPWSLQPASKASWLHPSSPCSHHAHMDQVRTWTLWHRLERASIALQSFLQQKPVEEEEASLSFRRLLCANS